MSAAFSAVERAVAAIRAGTMVVVVDSDDRGGEGALVMAAQHVSACDVHFMATEGRGLICVPMSVDRLSALQIEPMVARISDPAGRAFHVSVDVRTGTTTGISASDRASTIRALADPDSRASDFSRPGHVFPIGARSGGVIERDGRTEAAVDLVHLAGLLPVAVICEIADVDGEMARMPALLRFAEHHQIAMVTIAELTAYRRSTERLIDRIGQARLPLIQGQFTVLGYRDRTSGREHIALIHGDLAAADPVPVHVHTECLIGDAFGSFGCDCGRRLHRSIDFIVETGAGVVIYLRDGRGRGQSIQCAPARSRLGDIETQILADLGVDTGAPQLIGDPAGRDVVAAIRYAQVPSTPTTAMDTLRWPAESPVVTRP
ncbi:3,4-dihydroxy-2-butanone 4-phosphate synthase [Mycolicibacterium rhodesiae JS60]|nr:3,4-dihydroxy-2-butanone 4-phosphate synthase [Mycolicibacterium rhodesiae JS60]